MRPGLRFQIVLILLLVNGLAFALVLPVTLAIIRQHAPGADLSPTARFFAAFLAIDLLVALLFGSLLFFRGVVRPLEDLAHRTDRLAQLDFGPLPDGHQLGRLGSSFRQMVGALAEERARVERHIAELEEANRSLREAQESLLRSEKLATVGRLAAGVAHEIGNPLGGVVGYLELLKGRLAEDPASRPLVEGALVAVDRIDHTIRDLLDFSRPGAALIAPFRLAEAMDEALRLVQPQKRFASMSLKVDLPGDLPPVRADRRGLTQLLVNLLLNAADATQGRGRLELAARREAGFVVLSVCDDGPGLPPGAEEEIFEPFFTTKPAGQGTGLGLAISRRLVETWGGRIQASNRPGGGAAFEVTLPAST